MKINQPFQVKQRFIVAKRRTPGLFMSLVALMATVAVIPKAFSQPTQPRTDTSPQRLEIQSVSNLLTSPQSTSEITIRPVQLDGYELFQVTALKASDTNDSSSIPVQMRVQNIESLLQQFVATDFNPQTLQVTYQILNRQPVVYVQLTPSQTPQTLMTVTTLDAQLVGVEPAIRAQELTSIVRNALIRARQERQPEFLQRQGLIATVLTLGLVFTTAGVSVLDRRWRTKRDRLEGETPAHLKETPTSLQAPAAQALTEPYQTPTHILRQQLSNQQQRDVLDIQRRLLQVAPLLLWQTGSFMIVGLFPYTRWLQPLIFSAFKLLGVGVGSYAFIRLSAIAIDRFFTAFSEGAFLDRQASERLALRVSTFSRVLKSILAVAGVSGGLLFALAVLGINAAPLLAGAGIVGLAVSFAAQSLIKDTINGFLIVLEDQYAVGDVIQIGEMSGLVENMNLRITQLRNSEGRLITIPNSTISVVQNLSKDWARVDLAISVAYGTQTDLALAAVGDVGQEMKLEPDWQDLILDTPEVLGIDDIDHTGLLIRVWIKTKPLQQWKVAREFRRRLKQVFDERGIAIGMPQQALEFREPLKLNGRSLK